METHNPEERTGGYSALVLWTVLLLVPVLVVGSLWCGYQAGKQQERMIAADQATWIRRNWKAGMTIDEICKASARELRNPIYRDEWTLVDGKDLALGPVVSGQRICIASDGFSYWRPAQ